MTRAPTSARRVAVVVVPGVGDDAPGETLDSIAGHMVARVELQDGERRELLLSPEGNEVAYRAPWTRLHDPGLGLEVDVYEMRWADISRFPGGVVRLLYTLYALMLQVSTLGLEALRPLRDGLRRARVARDALYAAAWALAVPVMTVTAAVMLGGGALLAAVSLDGSPVVAGAIVVTIAIVAVAFGAWGAARLRRGGWRGFPPAAAVVIALALIGFTASWVHRAGLRVGLANALVDVVAYPFRIAWLAAAGLAGLGALVLAALAFRWEGGLPVLDDVRRRAALTGLLTLVIAPLGIALVSATIFAAFGAIGLQVASDATWGDQAGSLHCLAAPSAWTVTDCADPGASPTDWAFTLFTTALGPLAPTLLVAAALLALLLLVAVVPFLLAVGTSAWEGRRDRRAAAERQGLLMSSALDVLGNPVAGLLAVLAVVGGTVAVFTTWLVAETTDANAPAARLGGALALIVSGLVLLVRFLGVSPRRPLGSNTGALERLRIVLDIPFDVATYLRVSQPDVEAPRRRMLRRYRALLVEVGAGGVERVPYDALVIVAHSQGTVLSAATLFGDAARRPPARPLAEAVPGLRLPPEVSLLTCGCPLRQLYGERLPGQYDWVPALGAGGAPAAPLTGTWVNLFRSGDYVGRALWAADPDAAATFDPDRDLVDVRTQDGVRLVERCLGPGSHTGYWRDPVLGDWLIRLVGGRG